MPENVEIERRFLVDGRQERPWTTGAIERVHISQWYLDSNQLTISTQRGVLMYGRKELIAGLQTSVCQSLSDNPDWVVRIRRWNTTYYLTLKGIRTGASATEYEWEINQSVAESIVLEGVHPSIEKHRYLWKEDRLLWEIDEFEGLLAGLIIAEVELESEEMQINIPSWAGMELTYLKGWSNAELVRMIGQEKD